MSRAYWRRDGAVVKAGEACCRKTRIERDSEAQRVPDVCSVAKRLQKKV